MALGFPNIQIYQIANRDIPYIPSNYWKEATLRSSGVNLFLKFTAKARRPETSRSHVASRCSAFVCHGLRKAAIGMAGMGEKPRLAV